MELRVGNWHQIDRETSGEFSTDSEFIDQGPLRTAHCTLLIRACLLLAVIALQGCSSPDAEAAAEEKKPNRLIHEKSPYLLQHAFNPMDWYPWGNEAFEKARKENRPIFLSIGYSTCYWCHVMERKVFENSEIAEFMNQNFVNIKVDREERPDVDRVYMAAVQALTGRGGWPMSLFLTPALKPFHGGTYFPPEQFRELTAKVVQFWGDQPEKLLETSTKLTELLRQRTSIKAGQQPLGRSLLSEGFGRFEKTYDPRYGGFGQGPKFPRPVGLSFLLRYHRSANNQKALDMTLATLRKMARGGLFDHLGGGFHRYSVDGQWRVPHFEKMLYDQAQLVGVYLEAFQLTGDSFYSSIARKTLDYVLSLMTRPEGGFYSAEDAESAPAAGEEKKEGAFYVWTQREIGQVLKKEQAALFAHHYGVQSDGNALSDPHHVFPGKNILYVASSVPETSKKFNRSQEEALRALKASRQSLLAVRKRRPRPYLDDKILVSWNGLMISAFARASQTFGDPRYRKAAARSADFILRKLYDAKTGRLLRRYREGESRYEAHLADYAFLTMGLLDLYEADLDIRWLKQAVALTEKSKELFYDSESGGFFDTAGEDPTLLLRTKETYDSAQPSGNSITILNLLRLSQMTKNENWGKLAERTLTFYGDQLAAGPEAMPQMLSALDFHLGSVKQIVIAGDPKREDTRAILKNIHERYLPHKVVLSADGGPGQDYLGRLIPSIKGMRPLGGRAAAYICENYTCKLPTSDLKVLAKMLDSVP